MAVDNIGDPIHIVQGRQGRFGKVAEFRDIVDQIGIRISAAEELLIINEIIHHAVPDILHDAHIIGPAVRAEVHLKGAAVDHLPLIFIRNTFVARKNDLYIAVLLHQRLGESVHHIAQAAGFDKRIALRADESNASSGGSIGFLRYGCGLRGFLWGCVHRRLLWRSLLACRCGSLGFLRCCFCRFFLLDSFLGCGFFGWNFLRGCILW